jgi:hypothetical protein
LVHLLYQQSVRLPIQHDPEKLTLAVLRGIVWSKRVSTLLPKTDLIAFFDPAKPQSQRTLGLAKWEDVMRIAGDLFLDTQMFPARFYVSKFPSDEQLAAVIRK